MEKLFQEKIKTLKTIKSKIEQSRQVVKLDSLFKDEFMSNYFSKKDDEDK
jgi:hypothetical protein